MIRWIALAKGAGLVFCALALAGCPASTYVSPTEKYTFRAREPVDNDVEIFRRNYAAFAAKTADSLPKIADGKPIAISLIGTYQLGLALLSGAESQSFGAVTALLASDQADEFSLNQGFSDWLGRSRGQDAIRVRSSMWMIWPMRLEEPFVKDMAEHNDVDIIRLGSVGLTAERALDTWMRTATGDPNAVHPKPFSKRVMTLGVAVTALDLKPDSASATFFKVGEVSGAEIPLNTEGLRLFAWPADNLNPQILLKGLPDTSVAGEKFTIRSLDLPPKTNLEGLIEAHGAASLFQGQNDFRNMSVEITGDYKLGPIWQHMDFQIPGEKSTTPTWFVLWDAEEKLPLVLAYVP